MSRLGIFLIPCLSACAGKTLQWQVTASPAVQTQSSDVAIVAQDQHCAETADVLLSHFRTSANWTIDPHSETQLQLVECRGRQDWTRSELGQRSAWVHRGYAILVVREQGQPTAQLLGVGSSKRRAPLPRTQTEPWPTKPVAAQTALDLFQQLDTADLTLSRRAYPGSSEGTLRHLLDDAVQAERNGDLPRALELARLATEEHPSMRATRYLEDLERRLHVCCLPSAP